MISNDKAVHDVVYRAGTAARMAGLPVETLRVWERRYQLCDTQRSAHGQRLYSAEQIERLGLLKQLVDQGHAIGVLAGLSRTQLQLILGRHREPQAAYASAIRTVVVGSSLPRRLVVIDCEALGLEMRVRCASLGELEQSELDCEAELLIVEQSELDDTLLPRLEAVRARLADAAILVLYRFSSSAAIRALRMAGCLVARMPADLGELAPLCRLALQGQRIPLPAGPPPVPAQRFDEHTLATLAQASGRVNCECPRHLAEVLMTVGSFERYSAQCAARSPDDAELHAALQRSAGQARAVLEDALERLALAEGIPLPPYLADGS